MDTIAFYTCFLGSNTNWANVIPRVPSIDDDCYYFTNNPDTYSRLENSGWKRVWLNIPIENDNIRDCMNTKHLRCCPHEYEVLRAYTLLCWIDSKIEITDIQKVYDMAHSLRGTKVIALCRHPILHVDVWGEYTLSLQYEKYAKQQKQYETYITKKLEEGYSTAPLRHHAGFSVRRQCEKMEEIGNMWYAHIQECGIQDQISWQFVAQRFKDSIEEFECQYCWKHL
jgi:predicted 3-demethylubiquinone-9 3-methyltransferase (glyoxalase superfamily)